MSRHETLESKLQDLQNSYENWQSRHPEDDKAKALKEKVLIGLEVDIDRVQKQIKAQAQ